MPDKIFLEECPLYTKKYMGIPEKLSDIPRPRINLKCKNCPSTQTFAMKNYWFDGTILFSNSESKGQVLHAIYECKGCDAFEQHFLIKIDEDLGYIEKVGQHPPWSINIERPLGKFLGDHEETYKKGLICESQGYGIGAFVYYRRIIEEIIDELLNSIQNVIDNETEKETYLKALEEIKESHNATDKIKIVMDLLPSSLTSEENNPLGIMHSSLSKGVHSLTDEECLTNARHIRASLVFLVSEINSHSKHVRKYADSLKKLKKKIE